MDNKNIGGQVKNDAKKSLKWIILGLIVIVVGVAVAWILISRNNNGDMDNHDDEKVYDATRVVPEELMPEKVIDDVKFGDYDAMFKLAKNIQNGYKIGAIVMVDGVVDHEASLYSIVQDNPKKEEENEMSQVGTVFKIQDGETSDYPQDGDRVQLVGKVIEVSPLNFQLVTLKDFIKVVK